MGVEDVPTVVQRLLVSADELGWHGPYDFVHHLEQTVGDETAAAGGALAWLGTTSISATIGLAVGAEMVAVVSRVRRRDAARRTRDARCQGGAIR